MKQVLHDAEAQFRSAVLKHFQAAAGRYGTSFDTNRAVVALAPSGITLATAPTKKGTHMAFIHRCAEEGVCLKSGLYEMGSIDGQPCLYYQGPDGDKTRFDFKAPDTDPIRLSTPLGDWMCEKAPDLIKDYCQSFVACAAYDLFCGQGS